MSADTIGSDLLEATLETLERSRRAGDAKAIDEALGRAGRAEPGDPGTLLRLHEALLFHRAHPRSRAAIAAAERALRRIPAHVTRLTLEGYDLSLFDDYAAAGIGGTTISMPFSFDAVRWLAARFPKALSVDWEVHDAPDGLERVLPRLFPLVAEEAMADVGVDYRAWLEAARPKSAQELPWLLSRIEALREGDRTKALLYDALQFQVSWKLGTTASSRTVARWRFTPFLFEETFAKKRGVFLAEELVCPPRTRRLPPAEGLRALDLCRSAVLCRYRELHAFTYGDPRAVWEADLGRGAAVLICGIEPGRRLPLRAGFGLLLLRNGVPVGYGDAYALGEKLDVSFNVFYAFRDGESAHLYARLLSALGTLLGARVFRADPYQVGRNNEEGIASGAFFFYRRFGFVSADAKLDALARREEAARAADPNRRTSPATLRRLANAAVIWARDEALARRWARFSVRTLAARALRENPDRAGLREVLAAAGVPAPAIRRLVAAKESRDEAGYARALAADPRLCDALRRAGS
jgi:hypothetical protein